MPYLGLNSCVQRQAFTTRQLKRCNQRTKVEGLAVLLDWSGIRERQGKGLALRWLLFNSSWTVCFHVGSCQPKMLWEGRLDGSDGFFTRHVTNNITASPGTQEMLLCEPSRTYKEQPNAGPASQVLLPHIFPPLLPGIPVSSESQRVQVYLGSLAIPSVESQHFAICQMVLRKKGKRGRGRRKLALTYQERPFQIQHYKSYTVPNSHMDAYYSFEKLAHSCIYIQLEIRFLLL